MRGQALLLEAALIAFALIATLILASTLFKVQYTKNAYDLRINAERILVYLMDSGYIYPMVYGMTGSGDPQFAQAVLNSLVPPNYGYNFTVITLTGDKLYSITRNFDPATADGGEVVLLKGNGYIVILMLSR